MKTSAVIRGIGCILAIALLTVPGSFRIGRSDHGLLTLRAQAQEAEEETIKVSGTSPYMKIRVFDPGSSRDAYGDAALLESDGEYLLIDTGAKEPSNQVVRILKKKGIRKLSLYISHYHEDHCDYAASIMRDSYFKVKKVYLANPDPVKRYVTSYYKSRRRRLYNHCRECYDRYKDIISAAKKEGARIIELRKGDTFYVGDVRAKVLWDHNKRGASSFDPYDKDGIGYVNNSSLVTKFTLGERSFLTGGDIECSTERDLLASGVNVRADIFKLNHHGVWSANTEAFVRAVNPCYIYYSYKNQADQEYRKFGSAPDVAAVLRKLSRTYNILGSRYNGTIVYLVQDNRISVAADRHIREKKIRLRDNADGSIMTQTLVYNDAQKLYLDKRMLIPGTTPVSETAADPDAVYTGWKKTSAGWKYRTKSGTWLRGGWHKIGSAVYYFTVKGFRHEGWLTIKGKKYFTSRIGVRQTGWQMIDGKVYYFYKNGVMAKGKIRIGTQVWPLRKDGSLDLSKKNAPPASVLTAEHRHTTR